MKKRTARKKNKTKRISKKMKGSGLYDNAWITKEGNVKIKKNIIYNPRKLRYTKNLEDLKITLSIGNEPYTFYGKFQWDLNIFKSYKYTIRPFSFSAIDKIILDHFAGKITRKTKIETTGETTGETICKSKCKVSIKDGQISIDKDSATDCDFYFVFKKIEGQSHSFESYTIKIIAYKNGDSFIELYNNSIVINNNTWFEEFWYNLIPLKCTLAEKQESSCAELNTIKVLFPNTTYTYLQENKQENEYLANHHPLTYEIKPILDPT